MTTIRCKYLEYRCVKNHGIGYLCTHEGGDYGCSDRKDTSRSYYENKNTIKYEIHFTCANCIADEIEFEKDVKSYEFRRNKNCYGSFIPSFHDFDGYLKIGRKTIKVPDITFLEINGETIIDGMEF